MEDLPQPLLLDILNRLTNSSDLARCRLTCKTLNSLSYSVSSFHLLCSLDRYLKSRSSATSDSQFIPFKSIVIDSIRKLLNVDAVSIGVAKPLHRISYDDVEDEADDLYLTDVDFVAEWLPRVCEKLKTLSFWDFWVQSCWRRSDVLALISRHCERLVELELKNAWLSVENVIPMPTLTCLTLEFIRLDDEDLTKVNTSFPSLRTLNLIGVGGLKDPKIHLQHLKRCHWTISNAPLSLTILAPSLVDLELKCVKPRSLILETPSLNHLNLSIISTSEFDVRELPCLKTFHLESVELCRFLSAFPYGRPVKSLSLDSPIRSFDAINAIPVHLDTVFEMFPNLISLSLGPGAYSMMETSFGIKGLEERIGMKSLKDLMVHLVVTDIEVTVSFVISIVQKCASLSSVSFLIHRELNTVIANEFISRCVSVCPRIRWRWGMWKEGTKDAWVSSSV